MFAMRQNHQARNTAPWFYTWASPWTDMEKRGCSCSSVKQPSMHLWFVPYTVITSTGKNASHGPGGRMLHWKSLSPGDISHDVWKWAQTASYKFIQAIWEHHICFGQFLITALLLNYFCVWLLNVEYHGQNEISKQSASSCDHVKKSWLIVD